MLFIETPNKISQKEHPVKFTALLYLEEALTLEHYEDCADFIEIAKEFGAQNSEIEKILLEYSSVQAKPVVIKKNKKKEPEKDSGKFSRRF